MAIAHGDDTNQLWTPTLPVIPPCAPWSHHESFVPDREDPEPEHVHFSRHVPVECDTWQPPAVDPTVQSHLGPYLSPSDPVGPVCPYGTLSPSDFDYVGLVGPYGTLSPSDPDSVGPVGPYGTLSESDPDSVGPVGPLFGTLSRLTLTLFAQLARMGRCLRLIRLALLARMGRCPHRILLLLAPLARMGRCPCLILLALLASVGWVLHH